MKKAADTIYSFGIHSIIILGLILSGLLFLASFLGTAFSTDMETQIVSFRLDNPIINLLGVVLFIGLSLLAYRLSLNKKNNNILFCITSAVYLIAGGILILWGRTVPAADAMSVFRISEAFARGDLSAIHPTESYLSYYPHQIGLAAFYEIIIRLWNLLPVSLSSFHFIQILNVLMAVFTLFITGKTISVLWDNPTVNCCFLLLCLLDLPFIMYTSFVYSEVPSYFFLALGIYLISLLLKEGIKYPLKKAIPMGSASILCIAASICIRKNTLIPFIAICIVIFFQCLKERKIMLLVYIATFILCCLTALPLVQKAYELRAGNYLSKGITATSYFAMGMQDENSRCAGWYNGFNFTTYEESGLDVTVTNAKSREAIKERLGYFQKNPGKFIGFYSRKLLSQWIDGTYASRQATLATYGGRIPVITSLYEGSLSLFYIEFCNIHQLVLYLGFFMFHFYTFAEICRKKTASHIIFPVFIGSISIVGGFLFHIIWEANSRYILVYSLLMLPYSAKGFSILLESLTGKLTAKRNKR